jgi:molecular chaperone DnaJ
MYKKIFFTLDIGVFLEFVYWRFVCFRLYALPYSHLMASDPYAILGLSRDASEQDIKQAYRKMSKEWHPDKHKGEKAAEEKFKEINKAYELLSDPQKRKMYDQFGAAGGGGGGAGGFDFSNFAGQQGFDFSNMAGGAGGLEDLFGAFFGGGGSGGRRRKSDRGSDLEIAVGVLLKDAFSGTERTVEMRAAVACDTCKGTGAAEGSALVTCDTCSGTGQVVRTSQSFFGTIQQSVVCDECAGTGKKPEKPCRTCKGDGRVEARHTVTVRIPPGIHAGQRLKLTGQGGAGLRSAEAGDLYVHIDVAADDHFLRDGDDIRSAHTVHVTDAILGGDADVETLHGSVTLKIPEGTQPGTVLRIKSKGMPVLSTSRFGDHYVQVDIEIPKRLSRSERKLVEEWRELR